MIIEELTPGAGSRNEPDIKRSPISESRAPVKLDRKSGADFMDVYRPISKLAIYYKC